MSWIFHDAEVRVVDLSRRRDLCPDGSASGSVPAGMTNRVGHLRRASGAACLAPFDDKHTYKSRASHKFGGEGSCRSRVPCRAFTSARDAPRLSMHNGRVLVPRPAR
jgi:hypothetical protein